MRESDVVAMELVDELQNMDDADEEDWTILFKCQQLAIGHLKEWTSLPMRGKLALAITIVGARNITHFNLAFQILCDWSIVGGCYWLVQQELLRHAALFLIQSNLAGVEQTSFDPTELKKEIAHLLPEKCPEYLTHPLLRMKLAILRGELLWLLDSMRDSNRPHEVYVEYYSQFGLSKFVPWFLQWALELLRESEACFAPLERAAWQQRHAHLHPHKQHGHQHGSQCGSPRGGSVATAASNKTHSDAASDITFGDDLQSCAEEGGDMSAFAGDPEPTETHPVDHPVDHSMEDNRTGNYPQEHPVKYPLKLEEGVTTSWEEGKENQPRVPKRKLAWQDQVENDEADENVDENGDESIDAVAKVTTGTGTVTNTETCTFWEARRRVMRKRNTAVATSATPATVAVATSTTTSAAHVPVARVGVRVDSPAVTPTGSLHSGSVFEAAYSNKRERPRPPLRELTLTGRLFELPKEKKPSKPSKPSKSSSSNRSVPSAVSAKPNTQSYTVGAALLQDHPHVPMKQQPLLRPLEEKHQQHQQEPNQRKRQKKGEKMRVAVASAPVGSDCYWHDDNDNDNENSCCGDYFTATLSESEEVITEPEQIATASPMSMPMHPHRQQPHVPVRCPAQFAQVLETASQVATQMTLLTQQEEQQATSLPQVVVVSSSSSSASAAFQSPPPSSSRRTSPAAAAAHLSVVTDPALLEELMRRDTLRQRNTRSSSSDDHQRYLKASADICQDCDDGSSNSSTSITTSDGNAQGLQRQAREASATLLKLQHVHHPAFTATSIGAEVGDTGDDMEVADKELGQDHDQHQRPGQDGEGVGEEREDEEGQEFLTPVEVIQQQQHLTPQTAEDAAVPSAVDSVPHKDEESQENAGVGAEVEVGAGAGKRGGEGVFTQLVHSVWELFSPAPQQQEQDSQPLSQEDSQQSEESKELDVHTAASQDATSLSFADEASAASDATMVKPPTSLPNFLPQMPILSEPPKKQHQQQHHRGYCHSQGSEQSLQEVVSKTDSSLVYSPSTTTAGTTRTGLLGVQLL